MQCVSKDIRWNLITKTVQPHTAAFKKDVYLGVSVDEDARLKKIVSTIKESASVKEWVRDT